MNNKLALVTLTTLLSIGPNAFGVIGVRDYTEEIPNKIKSTVIKKRIISKDPKIAAQQTKEIIEEGKGKAEIIGSLKDTYNKIGHVYEVPGFITVRPLAQIAAIVGPRQIDANFNLRDKIYLQWIGAPSPRIGDVMSVFTPAVVLQSLADNTEFQIKQWVNTTTKDIPKGYQVAGYLYETNGEIQVVKIQNGIVTAVITSQSRPITLRDQIMLPTPRYSEIRPLDRGVQQSAVIISGVPNERIGASEGTYLYLNRGTKDGVKVGRMFEAVEKVELLDPTAVAPEVSRGEAMVVFASDSFSTAIITKQFDTIRVGSLIKTKHGQGLNGLDPSYKIVDRRHVELPKNMDIPDRAVHDTDDAILADLEKKNMPNLETEPELETIMKEQAQGPQTKDRRESILNLNQDERALLDALEAEDKTKAAAKGTQTLDSTALEQTASEEARNEMPSDFNDGSPALPPPPNAFTTKAPSAKNDKAKNKPSKKTSDESELNLLMQNF
jgi:hypothetical protein